MSCKDHHRSPTEIRTPRTPVHRTRVRSVGALAELDEIEDLFEESADVLSPITLAERGANVIAQAQRALQGRGTGIAEVLDGDDAAVGSGRRCRGGWQHRGASQQLVERGGPLAHRFQQSAEPQQAPHQPGRLLAIPGRGPGPPAGALGLPGAAVPRRVPASRRRAANVVGSRSAEPRTTASRTAFAKAARPAAERALTVSVRDWSWSSRCAPDAARSRPSATCFRCSPWATNSTWGTARAVPGAGPWSPTCGPGSPKYHDSTWAP